MDQAGNVVKELTYDSFGNIVGDTYPAIQVPLGFAGGFYDSDTGLIRFGYRDYMTLRLENGRLRTLLGLAVGIRVFMGMCLATLLILWIRRG